MYETFDVAMTPARARRLVRLANFADIDIDLATQKMAARDLITTWHPAAKKYMKGTEREAAQFLVDCKLRGIIFSMNRLHPGAVVAAIVASGAPRAKLITDGSADLWHKTFDDMDGPRLVSASSEDVFNRLIDDGESDFSPETPLIFDLSNLSIMLHKSCVRTLCVRHPMSILYVRPKEQPVQPVLPTLRKLMSPVLRRREKSATIESFDWRTATKCLYPHLDPFLTNSASRGQRVPPASDALLFNIFVTDDVW